MLVVDANVVISALASRNSKTLQILEYNSVFHKFDLVSAHFLKEEIEANMGEIISKSGLELKEVRRILNIIYRGITFIYASNFSEFLEEAKVISPQNDFPYVALAIKIKAEGSDVAIWTNDKGIKRNEGRIKVYSTTMIINLI